MKFTLPILSTIIAVSVLFAQSAVSQERPNVVVIMADDLSHKNLSTYGASNFATPRIDSLAKTGMRFDQGFAMPLCTPTRVAIMSGMHNGRNFVNTGHLEANQTSFGDLFQDAGYKTCIVGKWKLTRAPKGEKAGPEFRTTPRSFGFDEYFCTELGVNTPRYKNPVIGTNGEIKRFTKGEYGPDLVNDYALDFIQRHKNEPFLLYYSMVLVHDPYEPVPTSREFADFVPADPKDKLRDSDEKNRLYQGMVSYMDVMVGQLIDKLEALGLRGKTMIIFTGDNGTKQGFTMELKGGGTYPGGKGKTSNPGIHVPLIVSQPGKVPVGTTDALAEITDIFPTICDAAGIPIPKTLRLDGRTFLPQALGKENPNQREAIYQWFKNSPDSKGPITESAFNQHHRLYRKGGFFPTATDFSEESPLDVQSLDENGKASRARLAKVLEDHSPVPLRDLAVSETLDLRTDEMKLIDIKPVPANATQDSVWWRSSDSAIVRISKWGKATGLKAGTATLTAQSLDRSISKTIRVTVAK